MTLNYVDPPASIILNTRDFPIQMAYTDIPEGLIMDLHVDLIGDNSWFGGGLKQVEGPDGTVTVPIEVRVPSYFAGNLSVHAFLTPAGGSFQARVANAPELEVGIDRTPVNAIGVLCQPRAVQPGQPFVVNLWFTQTHPRPMDLIAVALDGDTKEYYGGFQVPVKAQQGHVSGRFDLRPAPLTAPLKFKAWLSPRGEVAPNYVTYTMLNIPLGPETVQPCNPDPDNEWTETGIPPANWVELHDVPKVLTPGEKANIRLVYNLVPESQKTATNATVSLMTWDWKTHEALEVASVETVLAPVFKEAVVALPVPKEAVNGRDGVFIIAFLPNFPGVEDRVYQVKLDAPMPLSEVTVGEAGAVAPPLATAAAHKLRHVRM
ncbi:hypothetical protein NSK_001778 [Nannochloropsis salina CCMP1776]|uniref:Uncharacterized protein n=1 Tax=Nannochloropsis salina CCMP1776 TaxID=1027361 RepID=A0A4D9DDL1_9STRA|nr:hypothetical protein NSK_001778 [Nannochloropsis salina CCMP1776]|eukprot:TFJ86689.1 hypothetical protein NSK_001778 [Nannochloropsis salina CCMP1776]